MLIIRDMRLVGEFHGYAYGRCYESTDGARCWQTDTTEEAACLDRPSARLFFDVEQKEFYLRVEGMSGMVSVELVRRTC
jgi:hypothetical protein